MWSFLYFELVSSYFAKVGTKEDIKKAFDNTVKFVRDFMSVFSPRVNKECHIDGVEVFHPSYLGNMEVTSEIKEIVRAHDLATSVGTDIHVDKTLGEDETVSSNSLGGRVKSGVLRKFRFMRRKAKDLAQMREMAPGGRFFFDDIE